MKHLRKAIAVLLTMILLSTMALPVVSFAYEDVEQNDHTTFEEFWDQMTDDEGNIDWTKLPKVLFKAFITIRFIEAVISFVRGIFGGFSKNTPENAPEAAPEVPVEAPVEALI